MANYPEWNCSLNLRDGADRASSVQFRVPEATAKLYMAAADRAARDATAVGLIFDAILLTTDMVEESRSVSVVDISSPYSIPAETVLRGNKIVLLGLTGAKGYKLTIPGRDATSYTPKADSIEIDIAANGDLKDLITLLDAGIVGSNGLAVTVTKGYVND